jgi:hypothetical protein
VQDVYIALGPEEKKSRMGKEFTIDLQDLCRNRQVHKAERFVLNGFKRNSFIGSIIMGLQVFACRHPHGLHEYPGQR